MKRWITPIMFFVMFSILGGCAEPDAKPTIGFSTITLTNPFFTVIADAMEEAAKPHGYELIVVSGERDVKKQADQIDDFIVRGVSAIVLNPCDSKSEIRLRPKRKEDCFVSFRNFVVKSPRIPHHARVSPQTPIQPLALTLKSQRALHRRGNSRIDCLA